jgi:hypothetical protein
MGCRSSRRLGTRCLQFAVPITHTQTSLAAGLGEEFGEFASREVSWTLIRSRESRYWTRRGSWQWEMGTGRGELRLRQSVRAEDVDRTHREIPRCEHGVHSGSRLTINTKPEKGR